MTWVGGQSTIGNGRWEVTVGWFKEYQPQRSANRAVDMGEFCAGQIAEFVSHAASTGQGWAVALVLMLRFTADR